MKLFDKQSLTLLVSVVTINVLCIIAVSYAYFTTQIKGNDAAGPITVVMGSMKIKYEDSDLVTLDNAIPGDYLINKFRITNTGTLDASYNLKIDVVENNFRDKGDLEYTLRRNGQQVETGTLPYTDGYILTNITIPSEEIHNYELEVKFKVDEEDKNQNDNKNRRVYFKIVVDSNEEAEKYVYVPLYKDNSGANIPELYQGLIPIYYNESNQIVIADVTKEWYNYDEHEWANAVLIDHTNKDIVNKFYNEDGTLKYGDIVTTDDILQMYVWIPRYKYQLFNAVAGETVPEQMINIVFETGEDITGTVSCKIAGNGVETCTNASNGEWYTHPAFTFGDTELGGIWVGKFETVGNETNLIILPNLHPYRNDTLPVQFSAIRNIDIQYSDKYNLKSIEIDTHLMKNMEWGAVAYLSNSIYGRYINKDTCVSGGCEIWINNARWITGCAKTPGDSEEIDFDSTPTTCEEPNKWKNNYGMHASTTDNIYGIYDMSGGTSEIVMGNIVDENGNFNSGEVEFSEIPKKKYYEVYEYGKGNTEYERGHLGDATRETLLLLDSINNGGWYNDNSLFPEPGPWFARGVSFSYGKSAGIFAFERLGGRSHSYKACRVVLTAQDGVD